MHRLSASRPFVLPQKRVRSGWTCTWPQPVMLRPARARRAVSFCAGPRQSPHLFSGSGPRPTPWRRGHHTAAPPPADRAWRGTRLENHHPYTHGAPRNQQSLDREAVGEIFSRTCQSPLWLSASCDPVYRNRRGYRSGCTSTSRCSGRIQALNPAMPARRKIDAKLLNYFEVLDEYVVIVLIEGAEKMQE